MDDAGAGEGGGDFVGAHRLEIVEAGAKEGVGASPGRLETALTVDQQDDLLKGFAGINSISKT